MSFQEGLKSIAKGISDVALTAKSGVELEHVKHQKKTLIEQFQKTEEKRVLMQSYEAEKNELLAILKHFHDQKLAYATKAAEHTSSLHPIYTKIVSDSDSMSASILKQLTILKDLSGEMSEEKFAGEKEVFDKELEKLNERLATLRAIVHADKNGDKNADKNGDKNADKNADENADTDVVK